MLLSLSAQLKTATSLTTRPPAFDKNRLWLRSAGVIASLYHSLDSLFVAPPAFLSSLNLQGSGTSSLENRSSVKLQRTCPRTSLRGLSPVSMNLLRACYKSDLSCVSI